MISKEEVQSLYEEVNTVVELRKTWDAYEFLIELRDRFSLKLILPEEDKDETI